MSLIREDIPESGRQSLLGLTAPNLVGVAGLGLAATSRLLVARAAFLALTPADLAGYDGEPVLVVRAVEGMDLEQGAIIESRLNHEQGVLDILRGEFWPATGDVDLDAAGRYDHCDPPQWIIILHGPEQDRLVARVADAGIPCWGDWEDGPREVPHG